MNLEGKIGGYSKKSLAIALVVVIGAGIVFYAGAEYEKGKLSRLKSDTCSIDAGAAKIKKKKKSSATDSAASAAPTTGTTVNGASGAAPAAGTVHPTAQNGTNSAASTDQTLTNQTSNQ